jgi:hypothetical protein
MWPQNWIRPSREASNRGPNPCTRSRSDILANGPWRIRSRISAPARPGPTPGKACNTENPARFTLICKGATDTVAIAGNTPHAKARTNNSWTKKAHTSSSNRGRPTSDESEPACVPRLRARSATSSPARPEKPKPPPIGKSISKSRILATPAA